MKPWPRAGNSQAATCCVCGYPIKTYLCVHPWDRSFTQWPTAMLAQVTSRLQVDPTEMS